MRLLDLFPGLADRWPADLCNVSGPPFLAERVADLVRDLDDTLIFQEVEADVRDGVTTIVARLTVSSGFTAVPFATSKYPSFQFAFAPSDTDWSTTFMAVVREDGSHAFQIDSLPLEITVPGDFLSWHGNHSGPGAATHTAGVALGSPSGLTTIRRNFRLRMEPDGEVLLDAHLPISIGPCRLWGIDLHAIHDLQFVTSPALAHRTHDWIGRRLSPDEFWMGSGGIAFGSIDIDWRRDDHLLREIRSFLQIRDDAEWVLEDILLPAFFFPPTPRHGTFGLRKNLQAAPSLESHLSFDSAPLQVPLGNGIALFLEKLYFATPPDPAHLLTGLTIEGGLRIPYNDSGGSLAIGIGIVDGDVLQLFVARTPTAEGEEVPVLHLRPFDAVDIDIVRGRIGLALGSLREKPFEDCFQLLGDILIRETRGSQAGSATGENGDGASGSGTGAEGGASGGSTEGGDGAGSDSTSDSPLRVTTASGRPFEMALTDVGWDRGTFTGNIVLPEGTRIELGQFALLFHEIGFTHEDGATFFGASGGLEIKIDPFTGGAWFRRLRGHVAGNPNVSTPRIGGFGGRFEIADVVKLEFMGHYTNEIVDGDRTEELGLAGSLVIQVSGASYGLHFDLIWGEVIRGPSSDLSDLEYMLVQVLLEASVTVASAEVRRLRFLYAHNMIPDLSDDDRRVGELKYYNWSKKIDPTDADAQRRLDAWKSEPNSFSFGMGFGVSFAGMGDTLLLTAFGLGFDSRDAAGLLISLDIRLLNGKKPIALAVFEYDFREDAFVLYIGFDLDLSKLIDNIPNDIAKAIKLSGSLTIGNRPVLVALGRLDDPSKWVAANIELDLFQVFAVHLRVALCFEYQEGEIVGGGMHGRVTARADLGIVELEIWSTNLILVRQLLTGTGDVSAKIYFDMGVAITLLRILRFGIVVELLAEWLAHQPDFFVFRFLFRIETPWFLPDIEFSLEATIGGVVPADRAIAAGPLLEASATGHATQAALATARIDGLAAGEKPSLLSVSELAERGSTATSEPGPAVPLDAALTIELSQMVEDTLGIGSTDPELGTQITGDDDMELVLRYRLTGLEVRRRPLGGTGPWETVETLRDAADERRLRWAWDPDCRVGDKTAPRRLRLNGSTPFAHTLADPWTDDSILRENPHYPCCPPATPEMLRLDFEADEEGPLPLGFDRRVQDSAVRARGAPCAIRRATVSGEDVQVAGFSIDGEAPLFILSSPDDLAVAVLRIGAAARFIGVRITARDARGEVVFDQSGTITSSAPFTSVPISGGGNFRRVELRVFTAGGVVEDVAPQEGVAALPEDFTPGVASGTTVELAWVTCITAEAMERWRRHGARCSDGDADRWGEKVNFLPFHEYEVRVHTEVATRHTTVPEWSKAEVEEVVGFTTAGPPGLNLVPTEGEELEPYVLSHHTGGRGLAYREESIHLMFSPELLVLGPPPESADAEASAEETYRFPAELCVATLAEPDPEREPDLARYEGDDWFDERRGVARLLHRAATGLLGIRSLSDDPRKLRYRDLHESSSGSCSPDDVWMEDRPLYSLAPFGFRPGAESLWEARRRYRATLRPSGAPVVRRNHFEPQDGHAFTSVEGLWTVVEGALEAGGGPARGWFGESDWDLYHLVIAGEIDPGGELGVAVLADPDDGGAGVWVRIRRTGSGLTLTVTAGDGGATLEGPDELEMAAGPVSLSVDVYADQIRVVAGAHRVEVPRAGRSPGACALVMSDARCSSLHVRGLAMYAFDFDTSRYEGFEEHVGSIREVESLALDAVTDTPQEAWSHFAGEVDEAMRTGAADPDRELVFSGLASELGLLLREKVDRTHLTTLRHASALMWLVESPEPLDFVEEIRVRLQREAPLVRSERSRIEELLDLIRPELPAGVRPVIPVIPIIPSIPLDGQPVPGVEGRRVPPQPLAPAQPPGPAQPPTPPTPPGQAGRAGAGGPLPPAISIPPDLARTLRTNPLLGSHTLPLNLLSQAGGVRATPPQDPGEGVAPPASGQGGAPAPGPRPDPGPRIPEIVERMIEAAGSVPSASPAAPWSWAPRKVGQGLLEVTVGEVEGAHQVTLLEHRTGASRSLPVANLRPEILAMLRGARIQLGPGGIIVDWSLPTTIREDLVLRVVQNGPATKALIVPLRDGRPYHPGAGRYELELEIVRRRWPTSDPPDDENAYIRRAGQTVEV